MIKETIKYVENFFNETKEKYPNLNDKILKSCLVYQFLYQKRFNADKSIDEILQLNNGEIGLIGPGNGCLPWFLEKILGGIDILHSHSILHDAFGRFCDHYSLDRGYPYAIPKKYTARLIKNSPFCGQISGLLYCIFKRLII